MTNYFKIVVIAGSRKYKRRNPYFIGILILRDKLDVLMLVYVLVYNIGLNAP